MDITQYRFSKGKIYNDTFILNQKRGKLPRNGGAANAAAPTQNPPFSRYALKMVCFVFIFYIFAQSYEQ